MKNEHVTTTRRIGNSVLQCYHLITNAIADYESGEITIKFAFGSAHISKIENLYKDGKKVNFNETK